MKRGLFLFFVFCAISNAYAQMDCESIPSCEELGYTQESCSGGKGVRCPFDETKFYCAGAKQLPDAPEPVVTPEDWTAGCADKIAYCTAYNNDCQCTACESGYLLSERACVPECDKSVDICAAESKTFNSANCACEACPTNYQFNSETKACEQIACDTTKVEHCATYSSDYEPCECTACESGYLLSDGACVPACDKSVDICAAESKTFNSANCTCEDCSSGYLFDNEVNECREACRKNISDCAEYDSEWYGCNCSVCEVGRYLSEKKDVYAGSAGCVDMFCNTVRTINGYQPLCPVDYCKQCSDDGVCIKCARGFTLEDGGTKCTPPNGTCVPGAILYDDFKCYDPDKAPSGRTPIGVIYWTFGKFLALSLEEFELPWSTALEGVGQRCSAYAVGSDEYTYCNEVGPYCDELNGTEKMDCLINKGAEEGSAISYCRNYGVTEADKGKWYLPNLNEARAILDDKHAQPFCLLNFALSRYGREINVSYGSWLSSTSSGSTHAYVAAIKGETSSNSIVKKSTPWRFRCVLDYSDGTEGYFTKTGCLYIEADNSCSSRCAMQTYKPSEDGDCVPCSSEELTSNCANFNGIDCSCIECDSGYTLTSDGHCT